MFGLSLELGELMRISLAASYAVFALVLVSFPGKPSVLRILLIVVSFVASAVTLWNTLGHRIAPWPATFALIFIVVLIHGTLMFRRGDFDRDN